MLRRARQCILASRQKQSNVTILVSNIKASTEFNVGPRDDHRMELVAEHDRLVRDTVAEYPGCEVRAEGDALVVIFQIAAKALRCALDVQRASALRNESAERPISVGVGLHSGELTPGGSDGNVGFNGTQVVMASRIASQAAGGEVLASTLLRELVASSGEFILDARPPVVLEGLDGEHVLYAVLWA